MTLPDDKLRQWFAEARRADRASVTPFGDLAQPDIGVSSSAPRRRRRAVLFPAAAIAAAAVLLFVATRRSPATVSLDALSQWRPASDILLSAAATSVIGEMPPLGRSVIDSFLPAIPPMRERQ